MATRFPHGIESSFTAGTSAIPIANGSYWSYTEIQGAAQTNYAVGAIGGLIVNTGSTASGALGHCIGVWGNGRDTTVGNHLMIGTEGKVEGRSLNAVSYNALVAYALWEGTGTNISTQIGQRITRQITTNGTTPKAEGNTYGLYFDDCIGGLVNAAIYIPSQTGASINVGVFIDAPTGSTSYALQLGGTAGTSPSGIAFGSFAGPDAYLYRSSAGTITVETNFIATGYVASATLFPAVSALTPGANVALNYLLGDVFTLVPDQTCNINAASVAARGHKISLIITTSGSSSFTLTFNTNFKSTGTLATGVTTAKVFVVDFVSNGTTYIETSRTTAM